MDALKAQFERIRQQLSALTGTQKMLVAALIAIMVLTMLYWGKFAQNAEMVSILGEQTLEDADIGPIDKQLELAGVQHTVVSGKVMVPADRRAELLANLMYARVLPSDTHSAFETMSAKLNPFSSTSEREATYTQATANELSDIISRFPGVANARVVLNAKNDVRIENSIPPSATVFITTRGSIEDKRGLVRAAADGVAHAVSGLVPSQISVIINRESLRVPESDDGSVSSDQLSDIRKARQDEWERNIRKLFMIDGLTVAVNCDVENRREDDTNTKFIKSDTVIVPEHTETNTIESTTTGTPSHEPGVSPNTGGGGAGTNTGASVDASPSGGSPSNTSNTSKEITENKVLPGGTVATVHIPAGKDKVLSAMVNVPLSYFPNEYKLLNPKGPDPDETKLAEFRKVELARIRDDVKVYTGLKTDTDVSVDYYADPPVDTTLLAAAVTPMNAMTTVTGHAKEIGIGVLAIVSLLMMATLARKSSPAPVLAGSFGGGGNESSGATATARSGLNTLGSGEDLAGEVAMANSALDGVEMDDDAIRTQQVLDQVSNMVKENPDGAAALVKRWLGRT